MATSTCRSEQRSLMPSPTDGAFDDTPALEVNASYNGILIGTRLLSPIDVGKRPGHPSRDDRYIIGDSPRADAPAPRDLLDGGDLSLVSRWGTAFLVSVTPQMTGNVAVGGKVYRLADYLVGRGSNFALPTNGQAEIRCGAMSFHLAHTAGEKPLPKPWLGWRWSEQKFTLGWALTVGVVLLLSFFIPPDGVTVSNDLIGMSRAVIPLTFMPAVPEKVPEVLAQEPSHDQGRTGKALAGDSGSMGTPKDRRRDGIHIVKGDSKDMHPGKSADDAKAEILNRGILGVLGSLQPSSFNSIFGRGSAVGDGQENILGGLSGAEFAGSYGHGGFGVNGTGHGGGGAGLATIGLGDQYNTLGRNYGRGHGIGNLGTRRAHPPVVTPGVPELRGSLDKEIIRRVVRLHMNEVRNCYDQELIRKSSLEGRLSVQFVISPVGQVLSSVVQSSTLGNVRVESCVTQAVMRWPFPKPREGGIAIVSYPFNFVSVGGN